MAAQSDFFEGLFTFEDKLKYKISDVSATTMKIILDAFYEIDISKDLDEEMAKEVLATAQYFQAPFLKKKVMNFLMETVFNRCQCFSKIDFQKRQEWFQFADTFQILEELKKYINAYFLL